MSHSSRTARAALVVAGLAVLAPPASAATYEQLSRQTGRAGASSLDLASAGVVSDSGTGGTFTTFTQTPTSFFPVERSFIRNSLANTTRDAGVRGDVIAGDYAEQVGLGRRFEGGGYVYNVGPLFGGAPGRDIATDASFGGLSVSLTGDGRAAILSDAAGGTRRVDWRTGATTAISPVAVRSSGPGSVDDSGRVIAGFDFTATGSKAVVLISGKRQSVPGDRAYVNPAGTLLASTITVPGSSTTPASHQVAVRRIPGGPERRVALPASIDAPDQEPRVLWVSPDGGQIAFAPATLYSGSTGQPGVAAQVLDTATGRWSEFGGEYAKEFGEGTRTAVSRNGRYALIPFSNQVAIVSLRGTPLPGGSDPLSAFSYLATPGYTQSRGARCFFEPATFSDYLAKPARFIAAPRSATVTVRADGALVKGGTTTAVQPLSDAGQSDPAIAATYPVGATASSITASVVDAEGRTVTQTVDQALSCWPAPEPEEG